MSLVEYLEKAEVSRFHYFIISVAFLSYAFTAMDVIYIAALLKAIQKELHLSGFTISVVAAIGYLGMFIGAISFGYIADKIGRKKALGLAIFLYSVFTALCGLAPDFLTLVLFRTIAGIGMGGALPIPGVYISEYIPARIRGTATGLIETAWVWGVILAITIEYFVLPEYGWRTTFLFGIIPIILVPIIFARLPESIRFLEKKGMHEEAVDIIKQYRLVEGEVKFERGEVVERSIKEILHGEFLRRMVLLIILWMALVYTYHGIFLWYPKFIQETFFPQGSIRDVLAAYLLITIFQIPGYYSATFLLDKIGRKKVLFIYLLGATIGSLVIAVNQTYLYAIVGGIIISIFNLGAWAGLYTYTPELFPTDYRGKAAGIAASSGRLSGVVGVFLTGVLYSRYGVGIPFAIFAIIHLIAAIAVIVLGIETKKITLEELTERV